MTVSQEGFRYDRQRQLSREKEIKDMSREKKEALIATKNTKWNFLVV